MNRVFQRYGASFFASLMVCGALLAPPSRADNQANPPGRIHALHVQGGVNVQLHYSLQTEWQIPAFPEPSPLQVYVEGDSLWVRCEGQCEAARQATVEVGLAGVQRLQLSNGGGLSVTSAFPVQAQLEIHLGNGGVLDARKLPALQVRVHQQNGGEVQVTACSTLDSTLRNGGVLRYQGDVQPKMQTQGGGAVRRLGEAMPAACQHMVDARDQKRYATVTLGEQEWFAENLAWLPSDCPSATARCGVSVYGVDSNDLSVARAHQNFQQFGALYDWQTARTACPAGWVLPSDEDWQQLERHMGLSDAEVATGIWRGPAVADHLRAGGDSGLQVLLAGWRSGEGSFNFQGEHANFWTATPAHADHAIERLIGKKKNQIGRHTGRVEAQFSVRCMRRVALQGMVNSP